MRQGQPVTVCIAAQTTSPYACAATGAPRSSPPSAPPAPTARC
ncbi:MAG: hypothetical protein ACP5NI_11770 [Acetobacteraceae bacterium]